MKLKSLLKLAPIVLGSSAFSFIVSCNKNNNENNKEISNKLYLEWEKESEKSLNFKLRETIWSHEERKLIKEYYVYKNKFTKTMFEFVDLVVEIVKFIEKSKINTNIDSKIKKFYNDYLQENMTWEEEESWNVLKNILNDYSNATQEQINQMKLDYSPYADVFQFSYVHFPQNIKIKKWNLIDWIGYEELTHIIIGHFKRITLLLFTYNENENKFLFINKDAEKLFKQRLIDLSNDFYLCFEKISEIHNTVHNYFLRNKSESFDDDKIGGRGYIDFKGKMESNIRIFRMLVNEFVLNESFYTN
ncbi:hypothetical protein [Mycoplasmopsis gallinacea]|uniref:Lipoprotein n=1 Tax=Mycoplasmopsis gallinacea TaxID=29556 RepID=A0A6H0V445_9BACT|nr:hypothetical protein [Mycoplasmopsis gallinacea]QIW62504.1 hypothetical protein GOQ20_03735 [Mycoplasmopsis gallinacea]